MSRFLFESDVQYEIDKWEDRRNQVKTLSRADVTANSYKIPNDLDKAEELLDKLEDEYDKITESFGFSKSHKHSVSEHALAVLERIAELVEDKNDEDIQQTMRELEAGTFVEEDSDDCSIIDQIEEENWKYRRRATGYDDDGCSFEDAYTDD